LEIYGCRSSS